MKICFLCLTLLFAAPLVWSQTEKEFAMKREAMVNQQIASRGVKNKRILDTLKKVRRHLFIPGAYRQEAYRDCPLPIGFKQTISQPYIVGLMTELLDPDPGDKVLEIGTGSGYQAAVLAELVAFVTTIEIIPELAAEARTRLEKMGYNNVKVIAGDGYKGWVDNAPYDKIIVTAAPPKIPQALVEQLKIGGRMILPVGTNYQELIVLEKTETGVKKTTNIAVRFVPMVKGK